jgi:hypothetical protein
MDELLPTRQTSINLERTAIDCEHFTLRIQRTNCSPGVIQTDVEGRSRSEIPTVKLTKKHDVN